jgi:membrane-associated protein
MSALIDLFLHLDKHLQVIVQQYGTFTYILLFSVIFAETGFVLTPFLPGDSLLFAAGSIAALGVGTAAAESAHPLNIHLLVFLLISAAFIGDNVNYWVGRFVGPAVFEKQIRFLKKEYLDKTHAFYEKHGGKTIILARFIPIIRTFAPFVAGIGKMSYPKFVSFSIVGSISWVSIFCYAGYFFGNQPFVKNNFSVVVIAIILISVLPAFIEYLRHKSGKA